MIKATEIKQIARNKLSGNWGKAISITAIYVAITYALSYCSTLIKNITTNTPILYYDLQIIFVLLLLPLSFGYISTIIKLINGKNPGYTTIINDAVLNFTKTIGVFFKTLLKIIIPSILVFLVIIAFSYLVLYFLPLNNNTLIGYLLLISYLYMIFITIFTLPYCLSGYALANINDLTSSEAIEQSVALMDGNKFNFIKLLFSFWGWFLFIFAGLVIVNNYAYAPTMLKDLVQAISSIFILPYIISSISVFYDESINDIEAEIAKEKNSIE